MHDARRRRRSSTPPRATASSTPPATASTPRWSRAWRRCRAPSSRSTRRRSCASPCRPADARWRGYFPLGGELTSNRPDWKEGLYLGTELPPDHPRVRAGVILHGPNLWPPHRGLPRDRARLHGCAHELGHALMGGIALGLGLPERWFDEHGTADPLILLRFFNYPSRPCRRARRAVGRGRTHRLRPAHDAVAGRRGRPAGAHRDGWIEAPPMPGTFVCNIGDMLDRMTGGRYRSLPHRVAHQHQRPRPAVDPAVLRPRLRHARCSPCRAPPPAGRQRAGAGTAPTCRLQGRTATT